MSRNYVAEIKERQDGEPCFLFLNLHADIGLGAKSIILNLPKGTGIEEAKALRDALHISGASIALT